MWLKRRNTWDLFPWKPETPKTCVDNKCVGALGRKAMQTKGPTTSKSSYKRKNSQSLPKHCRCLFITFSFSIKLSTTVVSPFSYGNKFLNLFCSPLQNKKKVKKWEKRQKQTQKEINERCLRREREEKNNRMKRHGTTEVTWWCRNK